MKKRTYFGKIVFFCTMLIFTLSACTQKPNPTQEILPVETSAQVIQISIENFAFTPSTITISTGTTVIWTNKDGAPHTVTSENNFNSGTLTQNQTFTQLFNDVGIFDYICTIHPSMRGEIIVR